MPYMELLCVIQYNLANWDPDIGDKLFSFKKAVLSKNITWTCPVQEMIFTQMNKIQRTLSFYFTTAY